MYYFYLIRSIEKKDKIYTGLTNSLKRRLWEHNNRKSIFTNKYAPWKLVYYEAYLSKEDARIREVKFKRHGKGNSELKKRIKYSLSDNY